MATVCLTQKLAKKIKVPLAGVPTNTSPDPFQEYHANLFRIGRAQYIIMTESLSLLSVIFPGRGCPDSASFRNGVIAAYKEYCENLDRMDLFDKMISSNASSFSYSKTYNRQVVGSMNDMIKMVSWDPTENETPFLMARYINDTPYKYIQYKRPIGMALRFLGQ